MEENKTEKEMSLEEVRRLITGEEEFVFVIARKDKQEVSFKMKTLNGEETSKIEKEARNRTIVKDEKGNDITDSKSYNETYRYLKLANVITEIKVGNTQVVFKGKQELENFMRTLPYSAMLAINLKYEEENSKIFDEIQKKI